jgi:hypothetical protein
MHQHIFYFVYSVTAWAEVTANLGLERIQLCGENRGGGGGEKRGVCGERAQFVGENRKNGGEKKSIHHTRKKVHKKF